MPTFAPAHSTIDHPALIDTTLNDLEAIDVHHVRPQDQRSGSFTFTTGEGRRCGGRFGSAFLEVSGDGLPERLTRVRCSQGAAWRSPEELADTLRTEIGCLLRDLAAHYAWCHANADLVPATAGFAVTLDSDGGVRAELVVCDPLTHGADIRIIGTGTGTGTGVGTGTDIGLNRFRMGVAPRGEAIPEDIADFVEAAVPLVLHRRTRLATRQLFDAVEAATISTLRAPAYTGRWTHSRPARPETGRA